MTEEELGAIVRRGAIGCERYSKERGLPKRFADDPRNLFNRAHWPFALLT